MLGFVSTGVLPTTKGSARRALAVVDDEAHVVPIVLNDATGAVLQESSLPFAGTAICSMKELKSFCTSAREYMEEMEMAEMGMEMAEMGMQIEK